MLSNRGLETERLWGDCIAVRLTESSDPSEIAGELSRATTAPLELAEKSAAAHAFYQAHFSLEHTVDAILVSIGHSEKTWALAAAQ